MEVGTESRRRLRGRTAGNVAVQQDRRNQPWPRRGPHRRRPDPPRGSARPL